METNDMRTKQLERLSSLNNYHMTKMKKLKEGSQM